MMFEPFFYFPHINMVRALICLVLIHSSCLLLQDLAFELTKVVCYKSFCEGDVHMWYHHINFTAKAKGAIDCKFFFAEVIFVKGELPVSCLCVIEPTDDGKSFNSLAMNQIVLYKCFSFQYRDSMFYQGVFGQRNQLEGSVGLLPFLCLLGSNQLELDDSISVFG